ncbi:MAG: Type I transmembrane sorting receptor [Alyxoria varia]|nr:MAG: Type I transmembrane sorting receptor [Alyxoria varia]
MLRKGGFLTALAALLSIAYAHPIAGTENKGDVKAFSIRQVAALKGSARATPEVNDWEYLCPVNVGGTDLMLKFDTGSNDLWVFSNQLSPQTSAGHTVYTGTGKFLPRNSFSMNYVDKSATSGNVFVDKVVIGGVTATSQAVEAATSVAVKFSRDIHSDGVLGMGSSHVNEVKPTPQKTLFDNVKDRLETPLFAVQLKHNAPGSFDFGFIDDSKYTGSITYTPVDSSKGGWMFNSSLGLAVADTGASIALVPYNDAANYYSRLDGAEYSEQDGGFIFPCATKLPDFPITVAGVNWNVLGAFMNYVTVANGYCFGGVQHNRGMPVSILGATFLKNKYVVFDTRGRIGFAQQS